MFVSYDSKSYHSAGRLRDQLAISRNLVDNRLCLCENVKAFFKYMNVTALDCLQIQEK